MKKYIYKLVESFDYNNLQFLKEHIVVKDNLIELNLNYDNSEGFEIEELYITLEDTTIYESFWQTVSNEREVKAGTLLLYYSDFQRGVGTKIIDADDYSVTLWFLVQLGIIEKVEDEIGTKNLENLIRRKDFEFLKSLKKKYDNKTFDEICNLLNEGFGTKEKTNEKNKKL